MGRPRDLHKALGQVARGGWGQEPNRERLFCLGLGNTNSDVTWKLPGLRAGRQEGKAWQGARWDPARSRCWGRADM